MSISWDRLVCLLFRIADQFVCSESQRDCTSIINELILIIDDVTVGGKWEQNQISEPRGYWPGVMRANLPKLLNGSLLHDRRDCACDPTLEPDKKLLADKFLSTDGEAWRVIRPSDKMGMRWNCTKH